MIARMTPLIALLAMAGCGAAEAPTQGVPHDPVMNTALETQMLVDPDLSQQNARNLAIVPPGPVAAHTAN